MNSEYTASTSRKVAVALAILATGILFLLAVNAPQSHVLELHFNGYVIPSALTLVVCLALLFSLIRTPARTEERIWLTVYFGGLAMYTFGEAMQRLSVTPDAAMFWLHVRDPATIIAPALYLFTLSYTNRTERRYPGTIMVLVVSALLFSFFYAFTNLLYVNTPSAMHANPWGYTPQLVNGGVASTLLLIDGLLILSLVTLIQFRRRTRNDILRKQSVIFIVALSINIVIPTFTDAVLPAAGIPIPPLGVTLSTVTGTILIYGLFRYQLLTINPTLFSNTILNIMQEAVVVTDHHLKVIYLNPTAEALLGTKLGRSNSSLLKVIAPDSINKFQQAFAGHDAAETIELDHVDIQRGNSDPVPLRLTSTRLRLGDYETRIMILANITKELRTRELIEHEVKVRTEELHRARTYLISSINSLEQGFILVNRDQAVEMVNGTAARLLRTSNEASVDKPFADIAANIAWNVDLPATVGKVLASQRHRQLNAAAEDGSFYKIYLSPILSGERGLGVAIIVEDITEQKILDRSKDEFFSIASHELRTPLTAIKGNMSMMRDYFPDMLKDTSVANMVNDSYSASTRLIEIVNDFLDSSSLEQGKMQFDVRAVDPLPVLQSVASDLKQLVRMQHNTLTLDGLKKLPKILADEARFRQIVYNILSNASKYTTDGHIIVTASKDAHYLYLHVSDTGKGMSPESQKMLFHKFQQAGDSLLTRDNTKGTGLGLYIARLLATNMRGNVELEQTEIGKGSTFKLSMPLAKS